MRARAQRGPPAIRLAAKNSGGPRPREVRPLVPYNGRHAALALRFPRMGGRAVEGTGLENRQGRKPFVGSNPTPSANYIGYNYMFQQEIYRT